MYIIGSKHKTTKAWSISPNPKPHANYDDAVREATRLCKQDKSKSFVVLDVKEMFEVSEVARVDPFK